MSQKRENKKHDIASICAFAAGTGHLIGLTLFFLSFFVSDYNKDYFLTMLSIGIIGSSCAVFGFGMFLTLMESITSNEKKYKPQESPKEGIENT